ncbi:dipeptidase [Symbiobacterium terraclitae]|uniref:dipeptidase n=1 Tax=Symbiobacterium terraclitae TaxID=557451 RepID=UPI0035B53865
MRDGDAYLKEHRDEHLRQLMDLLRIPSISALSEHKPDMRRTAEWLAAEMRRIGLTRVEIMETGGNPVVYAERADNPGGPTALIYGHYDVQPVDPLDLWVTPPFEPEIRDGKLYARGASDDKGQVFMHLKVIEAMLAEEGRLPVNVKLLIEGEEEVGSENLERFIAEHRDLLKADVVVISDTALYARGVPSLTYALRGLAALEVHVTGAKGDLHSGAFGGAAPNAAQALVRLLATLHRPDGGIAVAGFYEQVRPLSQEERDAFSALGFSEEALMADLGVSALPGEPGFTALERLWARPTLEINGIFGGFQGEGTKTVIPARAGAKITCRLVPDQDPERVLDAIEAHLKANCPPGVKLEIRRMGGAPAAMTPIDHPAIRAAMQALSEAYGAEARFIRTGGSIPVVGTFGRVLGTPCVLMGFGLEEENFHAPNEHFHLENFDTGMRALYRFWHHLAETMK